MTRTARASRDEPQHAVSATTRRGVPAAVGTACAVLIAYTVLAVLQTWPLVLHLDSHLPGRDLGDNAAFVWNLWWMREALASPAVSFFATDALFAPVGTSLVLHTHTALSGWLAATVLGGVTVIRAQNLLLIASLVLNGCSGYVLARLVSGAAIPSAVAGGLLLVSPVVAARLMGHFNLVVLWPLVIGCAAVVWWRQRPGMLRAVGIGIAAGALIYVDYYLTVYFVLFAGAYLVVHHGRVTVTRVPHVSPSARVWATLAVLAFGIAFAIAISSRTSIAIGSIVVSLRSPTNALSAGWFCLVIAGLLRARWECRVSVAGSPSIRSYRMLFLAATVTSALIAAPVVTRTWALWKSGGYVTSESSLRSGPRGIDAGTLVMGPPFNGLVGERVRDGYTRVGIDPMESSAWVGWGVLALAVFAWRARDQVHEVRGWSVLSGLFALWALGPSLIVFGWNTGMLLPQALARWIPVLNNARIPGRALLVVAICLTVLSALALQHLRITRRGLLAAAIVALALVEALATPLPLVPLAPAGVYARVAADPSRDTVLSVPFGIRDGFGQSGVLQHDSLYAQTLHRHPIAGGFVARMPTTIHAWYSEHEPFATLMKMSEGRASSVPTCEQAASGLAAAGVGYVVLYVADTSQAQRDLVENVFPVRRIDQDDRRVLYEVDDRCRASVP